MYQRIRDLREDRDLKQRQVADFFVLFPAGLQQLRIVSTGYSYGGADQTSPILQRAYRLHFGSNEQSQTA